MSPLEVQLFADIRQFRADMQAASGVAGTTAQQIGRSMQEAEKVIRQSTQAAGQATAMLSREQQRLLEQIQRTSVIATQGNAAWLEQRAAMLGVSQQAEAYLSKLKALDAGQQQVTVSAKQTAFAMRTIPAQLQDIAVSIQGGQNPMTVLSQQGSQLATVFGGVGPAIRGVATYVAGLVNPFTVAAAAVAVLAVELAHAESQLRQLNSVQALLAGTGRSGLFSTAEIKDFIAELSKAPGVTRDVAAQIVSEFAKAHDIGGALFKDLSRLTADYARATGTDIPTAAKTLAKAFSDPVQGAKTLEDALGSLTGAQGLAIERLDRLGDRAGAQKVLFEALESAVKGVADRAMTPLQNATNDLGNAWQAAQDRMSRSEGLRAVNSLLSDAVSAVTFLINNSDKLGGLGTVGALHVPGLAPGAVGGAAAEGVRSLIASTQMHGPSVSGKVGGIPGASAPASAEADAEDLIKRELEVAKAYRSQAGQIAELTEKRVGLNKALQESIRLHGKESEESKKLRDAVAGINEQIARTQGQGENGIAAQRAARLIAVEENRRLQASINSLDFSTPTKLTDAEKKVIAIQEELKGSLLGVARANKLKELAGAQAAVQDEKSTQLLQQQYDAVKKARDELTKQAAAAGQQADSIRQNAEAQEAANATFGKSKTAIEEMVLAQLKLQAAEADSSDTFDPRYVAGLNAKVAAQERYVAALQKSESQQIKQRQDEAGRLAAEETQTLQLQASLLGRSREEREAIIAQRKVEIELAKEIAEIDRSGASDPDKQARREQARANALVKSQNAAQKVVLDEWEHTADRIGDSLADAIISGGKNARESLKRMFDDLILRPVIKAALSPVTDAITNAVTDLRKSLGVGGSAGTPGGGTILNIPGLGSFTGSQLGFLGTIAAGGAMVGSTIGQMMGLKGAQMQVATIGGSLIGGIPGALLGSLIAPGGGPKVEGKAGPGMDWYNAPNHSGDSAAEELRKNLQGQFDAIAQALGSAASGIQFGVGFGRDPKGTAASSIGITANRGGAILADAFSQNVGRSDEEFQQAFASYANRTMLRALQSAHIDGIVGKYLDSLGDLTNAAADKVTEALARVQRIATERAALDEQVYVLTHTAEEKLIRDRKREIDALDETNRALGERVQILQDEKAAAATLASVLQKAADEMASFRSFVMDLNRDIRGYIDGLNSSSRGGGSLESQKDAAFEAFMRQIGLARSGDRAALQGITGYANTLIDAQTAYTATSKPTADIIAMVKQELSSLPQMMSDAEYIAKSISDASAAQIEAGKTASADLQTRVTDSIQLVREALKGQSDLLFERFGVLDHSVDGLLTFDEVKEALGGVASDATLHAMIERIDANGDGQISKLEALNSSILGGLFGSAGMIVEKFFDLDQDLSSLLDFSELKAAVGPLASDDTIRALIAVIDANGDQQISKQEATIAAIREAANAAGATTGATTPTTPAPAPTPAAPSALPDWFGPQLQSFISAGRTSYVPNNDNGPVPIQSPYSSYQELAQGLSASSLMMGLTPEQRTQVLGEAATLFNRYSLVGAFADGGLASGLSLVGERGPELVDFRTPARVYTAQQTQEMLGGARVDTSRMEALISQNNALMQRLLEIEAAGHRGAREQGEEIAQNTRSLSNAAKLAAAKPVPA